MPNMDMKLNNKYGHNLHMYPKIKGYKLFKRYMRYYRNDAKEFQYY